MRYFTNKIKAFSLAEALITLLIVCLITLASVPIITKKKRNVDNSAHGSYICTIHNGKYVYFNSNAPVGNIEDISTWAESSATDHCKFVPPVSAKNFGVTLIGGGGAGAKGLSGYQTVLGEGTTTTYTVPNSDDWYQLTLVGGGGGGGFSDSGTYHQTASGGGAGAYVIGRIKFPRNTELIKDFNTENGHKSETVDWDDSGPAGRNGGSSSLFVKKGNSNVLAYSVEGGISATGAETDYDGWWGGSRRFGGDSPRAAKVNVTADAPHVIPNGGYLNYSDGMRGTRDVYEYKTAANGYKWGSTVFGVGTPVPQRPICKVSENGRCLEYATNGQGNFEYEIFGSGGAGTYNCESPNYGESGCIAYDGSAGYAALDKIVTSFGKGGTAAVPNTIPMPSINGYLKIMVGAGGKSDDDPETSENGGETKVELYNKSNNYIRQYVANGGLAGTNDDSLTEPQAGQNSLWNDRGGGGVGTCTEASAPSIVQKTGTHLKETGLCKRVLGLGRSMSNANLFGKVDGDLGPEYDMYLQWMKEYNTGYMHRAWDINGFYALNEPQSCFHDASTGKLKTRLKATDVEIADRENYHPGIHTGDETFPVLSWFQYPNRPTSNTACASLWYCSHDKAREQLGQEDEQGKKYTLPDTLNDNNFMCTFTEGSTPAETNKLREKIQAYADNPTESNLNAVWNLIKNTKSTLADNSQYHTYRTRWTPTSGDTLDELRASNFKYVCLEPEKVAVTETWNELIPARPARCENSTDGSAFGAGGGGGGASTSTVGVFGYGGNGAPGAVIIEW